MEVICPVTEPYIPTSGIPKNDRNICHMPAKEAAGGIGLLQDHSRMELGYLNLSFL